MKNLISLLVGFLFALGLGMSGMTQNSIVRGFFDLFGSWNYSLAGVMIGAISVHATVYYFIKKRTTPLLDSKFYLPTSKDIDRRIIFGPAIFGIGWGIAGVCPGPAIVSLMGGKVEMILFVLSMLGGMVVFKFALEKRFFS